MAGWYDPFLPTQLNDYVAVRHNSSRIVAERSRLIIGPWTHAGDAKLPDGFRQEPFRPQSIAVSLPWFDELLDRNKTHNQNENRVKIFVMGKNQWRSASCWPLPQTHYTSMYLHSDGKANSSEGHGYLSPEIPTSIENADHYDYDPRNPVQSAGGAVLGPTAGIARQNDIESRSDVLVFTTAPLGQEVEVTGPVSASLCVATSAPGTDFTAKLVDVHPDGSAYNVCDGILRLDKCASNPQAIKIEMWPTSIVFLRGHRIRLEVSSSNFPRFDRNPNTGTYIPTENTTVCAHQTLFHDPQHRSMLILPVIPVNRD